MKRRLSLCSACGQHFRGAACDHARSGAPRSRSAVIASLLGLTVLGAGCSGAQETEAPADGTESGETTDSLIAAPPTEVDPAEILIAPDLPPSSVIVPLYGVAPLPELAPEPPSEGSGEEEPSEGDASESEQEETIDEELQEQLNRIVPQPVYGVPPL